MTRESSLWNTFKGYLPAGTHAVRIENSCELGTPDVNLCMLGVEYWVELKCAKKPARDATLVKVDHFTKEQRQWLIDRCQAGGNAYVLLQVDRMYFLIRGDYAALMLGYCTFQELEGLSMWHGHTLADLRLQDYRIEDAI